MDFFRLRPAAPTAAATEEALERARTAMAEAQQRLETGRVTRDSLLLDGEEAQLAEAERALVMARGDIERTEAMVAQLEARLVTTRRAERIAKADAAVGAFNAADADLRRWWEKNEAALRRILTEGRRLHVAVDAAAQDIQWRQMMVRADHPDAEFTEVQASPRDHRDWPETIGRLIQHGVSKPRENIPAQTSSTDEPTENVSPATSGPGSLVQAIPASRGGGALAATFGGQSALHDDSNKEVSA